MGIFATGILLNFLLMQANEYKISLTAMPITAVDVQITAGNSSVLWHLFMCHNGLASAFS
jgi:hypothetical protein